MKPPMRTPQAQANNGGVGSTGVVGNPNTNLNNQSVMDQSNMNLLNESRANNSQTPVYNFGRQFDNSSYRA